MEQLGNIFLQNINAVWAIVAALFVVALLCSFLYSRHRTRKAWVEGYRQALDVHQLAGDDRDEDAIEHAPGKWSQNRGPSWKAGYLACLTNHSLPLSERDSQELWHDPYTDMDGRADIAASNRDIATSINLRR